MTIAGASRVVQRVPAVHSDTVGRLRIGLPGAGDDDP